MLAKLTNGYYFYSSSLRLDLIATNCASAWIYQGKIPDQIGYWLSQGRPFRDYEVTEEKDCLILKVSDIPEISLKPAELHKVLPIVFDELALREPKRTLSDKQEAKLKAKQKKRDDIFARSTLKNIALKIAYFGWDYDGLARQLNTALTIEELLLQACEKCCLIYTAKDYKLTRCGRTDKGVSAFSQVMSLNLRSKSCEDVPPTEEYDYVGMLNNVLPTDIRILAWANVGLEFDSRFQALFRSYKYYFPGCDLDVEVMEKSLHRFIGTHNYRGFCKADKTLDEPNFYRTISYISITKLHEDNVNPSFSIYCITILGHAFLWHQIRNMVSVLLRLGMGLESPKVITDILKNKVKYSYGMASELPLVLFDCEFENIEWNFGTDINLSRLWFESVIKTSMVKELIGQIHGKHDAVKVKDVSVLCDTKTQSILSRPYIK